MSSVTVVKLAGLSRMERDALLQRSSADLTSFFDTVRPIIAAVRNEGDVALVRYGAALDGAVGLRPDALKASAAEFDAAFATLDPELTETIRWPSTTSARFMKSNCPIRCFSKKSARGPLPVTGSPRCARQPFMYRAARAAFRR
jgi:histidinol dehydrogenase